MNKRKIMSYDELPVVIGVKDVMTVLDISRNTAYQLLHSDGFPKIEVGKRYRIPRNKFIEWIDKYSAAA